MDTLKEIFSFKKRLAPKSDVLKSVDVVQLWYVRWCSRHGIFSYDTKEIMEAFTSRDDAEAFANSLRAAFKLIKHTSGNNVWIEKS